MTERKINFFSQVINDNSAEILKTFPDNHFDACVTDPPYGLKFMGKKWDYQVPSISLWQEVIRVLKPGAHILCACGTRTQHRMAVNLEDAGFEIRDVICWHYGEGFPKSLDISKAIDKELGAERKIRGNKIDVDGRIRGDEPNDGLSNGFQGGLNNNRLDTEPCSIEAQQYDGWGTALKPATELWTLARKPLSEKTVAANVLKWGTGGINIDGCRVGDEIMVNDAAGNKPGGASLNMSERGMPQDAQPTSHTGRFPANVIFDEFMAAELDRQSGVLTSGAKKPWHAISERNNMHEMGIVHYPQDTPSSSGGASRFFYVAKPATDEKEKGLYGMKKEKVATLQGALSPNDPVSERFSSEPRANIHPTVKPVTLMQYLIRLITPDGGHVLDPFNGSGTTGIAARLECKGYTGIELDDHYCKISEARIASYNVSIPLF